MIFVGQASLRRAIAHYVAHYHTERNHQGLENQLIGPNRLALAITGSSTGGNALPECSTITTAQQREEFGRDSGPHAKAD